MSHELVHPMARRDRRLPDRDSSRYSGLRLVVQRNGSRRAVVSIIFTNVGGQRLQETRLGTATIDVVDENDVPLPPGDVLRRALAAVVL